MKQYLARMALNKEMRYNCHTSTKNWGTLHAWREKSKRQSIHIRNQSLVVLVESMPADHGLDPVNVIGNFGENLRDA